mmetsp:Transcript_6424/g.16471  ORF Transcript_6424/g.16471 Transcript_6424/m.16471 type:complete len:202 (-) Transcript_6424:44-649(-)
MADTGPWTVRMRSSTPGTCCSLVVSWILAPLSSCILLMHSPPLPMTDPAAPLGMSILSVICRSSPLAASFWSDSALQKTSSSTFLTPSATFLTSPVMRTTRSWVFGKYSLALLTLILLPVLACIDEMVCPPLPMTVPASLLPTRSFMAKGLSEAGGAARSRDTSPPSVWWRFEGSSAFSLSSTGRFPRPPPPSSATGSLGA